jgi:diaminopimelate decarboxylase
MGLDVVSGGELYVAWKAGFPLERVHLHGNNKSPDELTMGLELGVGRVVVDNFYELDLLNRLAGEKGKRQAILLRLSPSIDTHTHRSVQTGVLDSKFGFTMENGQAARAVELALQARNVDLLGLHAHLGSQIFEMEPFEEGLRRFLRFAAEMKALHGWTPSEISPGGGWAVNYLNGDRALDPDTIAEHLVSVLHEGLAAHDLPSPALVVEPGRYVVARAGVAVYTIGSRKEIPGMRTYISVDGGMADNIRPAIYGSRYEAIVANKPLAPDEEKVTIAGKFCESGDILIRDAELPRLDPGDTLVIPTSGAYCLTMASNYNLSLRPPVVLVGSGHDTLMRRRETYDDLQRCDVP